MMNRVVLYHGNCFDGTASAWAAWKKLGDDATYRPVTYGDGFDIQLYQDCCENANINDELYILDFSYKRELLELLHNKVRKLVVLDHHKTAQKDLEGLDFCIFDMEKSGARLTWEYFHYPKDENNAGGWNEEDTNDVGLELNPFYIPKLIQYIEDRDLWRFKLNGSHFINAFIQSFLMEIKIYDAIAQDLENDFELCKKQGVGIERYKNTMVEAQCKHASFQEVGGYIVPVCNSTILFSEVGSKLCELHPHLPFAAYFTVRGDRKKQWGLRSIGNFDVSEVAKKLGGGGHRNAAGFIEETNK
jgi:uncharacterized protein